MTNYCWHAVVGGTGEGVQVKGGAGVRGAAPVGSRSEAPVGSRSEAPARGSGGRSPPTVTKPP